LRGLAVEPKHTRGGAGPPPSGAADLNPTN
jgi:hypothetical protein